MHAKKTGSFSPERDFKIVYFEINTLKTLTRFLFSLLCRDCNVVGVVVYLAPVPCFGLGHTRGYGNCLWHDVFCTAGEKNHRFRGERWVGSDGVVYPDVAAKDQGVQGIFDGRGLCGGSETTPTVFLGQTGGDRG